VQVAPAPVTHKVKPVPTTLTSEESIVTDAPIAPATPVDVPSVDASVQLESILSCKPGTEFTSGSVQTLFQTLGLIRNADNYWEPDRNGPKVSLFGNEVAAAFYFENRMGLPNKKVQMYFKKMRNQPLAAKFGKMEMGYDDAVCTEDCKHPDKAFYFKKLSKTNRLVVQGTGGIPLGIGERHIWFKSAVTCQIAL
jgi:hypothetical protein